VSRHVLISDSTPAADVPDQVRVIERPEAPSLCLTAAGEIPLEVWRDTLLLVRQMRTLQRLHKQTLDRVALKAADDLAELLDLRVGSLAALLAEADARRGEVEGGGL